MVGCMAVMAREAWTDERLDDFKENVNQRFDQIDRRFDEVDKRFDKVDARLDKIDTRMDSMQRTMIIGIFSLLASIWASVIGAVLVVLLK
jgi:DNA anti-recombination protein RmuC